MGDYKVNMDILRESIKLEKKIIFQIEKWARLLFNISEMFV